MQFSEAKFRFGTIMLVFALMFSYIVLPSASIHAQEDTQRVMLPLFQSGQQIARPANGPMDVSDPDSDLVALGGSCYWGNGSGRQSFTPAVVNIFSYTWVSGRNTSSCRDINLHVQVQNPWAKGCRIDVVIVANGKRYNSSPQPNRWYTPVRGLQSNEWSGLVGVTGPCGKTTVYRAS